MWKGYDLHCVSGRHDKFYRIIRCGGIVVIRFGRRGQAGQRILKALSLDEGGEFAERQVGDKLRKSRIPRERYSEVRRDYSRTMPEGLIVPGLTATNHGEVADVIEEMYLSRWREASRINLDTNPGQWAVFGFLLANAKIDLVADFILDEIKANPCAIDASRDLVLGRISGYERARSSWSWVSTIGPADVSDTNEIASTALGLYRPGNPSLSKLFPTARRLVGAS